jgi:LemA protein
MKNKGCFLALGVIALIALGLVVFAVGKYNALVELNQEVDKQWAQVENVYQRRADLIPNLVSTVKGAADFEKGTLESVIKARARATQVNISATDSPQTAQQLKEFQEAQGELSSALSRLLVTVERYPEIKANANFRDLQAQLEGTENRIAVERKRFNEAAQGFNTAVKRFPTVLFAGLMGFQPKPYFEAAPGAERPPEVKFDFGGESS